MHGCTCTCTVGALCFPWPRCADTILTAAHDELAHTLVQPPPDGISVQVLLLHGMGGLGKSTLAKVAYQAAAQQHFGDGNYGHCLLQPDKYVLPNEGIDESYLKEALYSMLLQFKLQISDKDDLGALRARMSKQLARRDKPVLLLVDDVFNSAAAELLLGERGKLAALLPMG